MWAHGLQRGTEGVPHEEIGWNGHGGAEDTGRGRSVTHSPLKTSPLPRASYQTATSFSSLVWELTESWYLWRWMTWCYYIQDWIWPVFCSPCLSQTWFKCWISTSLALWSWTHPLMQLSWTSIVCRVRGQAFHQGHWKPSEMSLALRCCSINGNSFLDFCSCKWWYIIYIINKLHIITKEFY